MQSFVRVAAKKDNKDVLHLYPEYSTRGKDIMFKGGNFYAIYNDQTGLWETDEDRLDELIDNKLLEYAEEHYSKTDNGVYYQNDSKVSIGYLHVSSTKQLKAFRDWVKTLAPNHNYRQLDNEITRADEVVTAQDYRSKRLSYKIGPGSTEAYDLFMNTCYAPEEREKLEWALGSILTGKSKKLQKFIVIYGKPGTGKSTFFNIMEMLFEGYWSVINVDELVSSSSAFGTAALKDNPLVCIQHDADLSRIEKNDILNSIVSHEKIFVNEKFKRQYEVTSHAMIFIGTNDMVSISDTKQGITRRMIDVYPTGNTLPTREYDKVKKQFQFELGAIAQHCIDVFNSVDPDKYIKYKPFTMIKKSNIYTSFVSDNFLELSDSANDPVPLRNLYKMFKDYMVESGYQRYPTMTKFKEVMLDFYDEFRERYRINGIQYRSVFVGFKKDCLDDTMSCLANNEVSGVPDEFNDVADGGPGRVGADGNLTDGWKFKLADHTSETNILDEFLAGQPAQYSNKYGVPKVVWDECKTVLKNINTAKEHYVRVPLNLICIDFDLKDAEGNKSRELNIQAAEQFPLTYAEWSKSGGGLHLHYIYDGDPEKLSRVFDDNIEVKVYTGNSALRRRLTECNNVPIAHISSGLPLKEETKLIKFDTIKNEKAIRTIILRNLAKEYHGYTKPSIDFIYDTLEKAYYSGVKYDVSDLRQRVLIFANESTNQAAYCVKKVVQMHFQSDEPGEPAGQEEETAVLDGDDELIFVDVEVFPNLLIVCWNKEDSDQVIKMINPKSGEIDQLCKHRLVGFNNRKYDNHILYARMMGYTNEGLYNLSKQLVNDDKKLQLNATFSEAYNLSYADVYDIATVKQSLKKWEIELGIHHLENSYPWDEPLAEEHWDEVADYCCNDVLATKAVWHAIKGDVTARQILAKLSGLTINHTTRQHTTKIIFGDDKKPDLVYVDLAKEFPGYEFNPYGIEPEKFNGYDPDDKKTWIVGAKSVYLGEDPSEGGCVRYKPGMYYNVGLNDIASLHPSTIIKLNLFGKYTKRYEDIVNARLAIKHKEFGKVKTMLDGRLAEFVKDEAIAADLAQALKIVINSVYGYTSATFDNPFKDPRNVDNIVAKRGALFMILLRHELEKQGIDWVHVKTDSIKIPNETPEATKFIYEFGQKYGYTFEHESTYQKMCLINGSTYIAYVSEGKHAGQWVAVAAQFQHPYVFKTLFTHETIKFKDLCEIKEVRSSMVLDMNEGLDEGEHAYKFVGRIGSYVPVVPGAGGGILLRDKDKQYRREYERWQANPVDSKGKPKKEPDRFAAVTGTSGYRWLDAETLKDSPKEKLDKIIDKRYYQNLVDEAIAAIEEYGSFEEFMNYGNVDVNGIDYPPDDELPFPD